jgi:hypothetical protein
VIARLLLLSALGVLVWASIGTEPVLVSEAQPLRQTPTATPTFTAAPTFTATPTSPATSTSTPTATSNATATATPTVAAAAPTSTATATLGRLAPLVMLTFSPTPTRIPTASPTATRTVTTTLTPTSTRTSTATLTVTPTATVTPTPVPALIADVASSSITRSSATITWTTTLPTTSEVDYGGPTDVALRISRDPSLVTAHSVVLAGLQPGTFYRFLLRGVSAAGASSISGTNVLSTAPAGSGPEVVDAMVSQATGTTATLGWATSTGMAAQLEYGPTPNYGAFTLLKVFSGPNQQMTLTGLLPATTYHFRVKAWDAQGALGASADGLFSTAPNGAATLIGDDTVQTDRLTLAGGQAVAYQYVASQSGLASQVRLYIDAGSTAPVARLAIYADATGAPGAILTQGSTSALVPGWTNVSVSPLSLLLGTRYWLSVLNPLGPGSLNLRQFALGGSSALSLQSSLAAFPQPFAVGVPAAHSPLSVSVRQVPPSITLTGPGDGSVVTGPAQLSAVVDDDSPVARLQFFVDGLPVGPVLTAAPYSISWNSVGLSQSVPHTIVARATDALGRSGASAAASVQVDNGPTISNVSVAPGLTATSARVTWTTDVPADAQVEYGLGGGYELSTPADLTLDMRHDMQLTGLTPGTVYHYRVKSRDAAGAASASADRTFYTLP